MIKLDSILIEEFRGIRKLSLSLNGKNFAVCGRNGTGKSGVVDAIEFALTGNISRLSGEGTDRLSVKKHAPHVDSRNNPENARVTLTVSIPSLTKMVTIVRTPKDPRSPTVTPSNAAVLSVLKQIEEHPELVLTRREIIRYVLATEGKRAEEVQAVLKLDRLEYLRSALQAISNARTKEAKIAKQASDSASVALCRAVGIPALSETELLNAVNAQREILAVPPLSIFTSTTSLKEGVATPAHAETSKISKTRATTDLAQLHLIIDRVQRHALEAEFKEALESCDTLAGDAVLLKALSRENFLRTGLDFIDEPRCPFCDNEWKPEVLCDHVKEKLRTLESVGRKRAHAEKTIEPIVGLLSEFSEIIGTILKYARAASPPLPHDSLNRLLTDVDSAKEILSKFLPLVDVVTVLTSPPVPPPEALKDLKTIESYVKALPEPSKEDAAREYLIICHERLEAYREARRLRKKLDTQASLAAQVVKVFTDTSDGHLNQLYRTVEQDFATIYGALNTPDEADFAAKLTPSIGKLGFNVNFYGRGFFPPGAYHSEGHQDAMGLCLYLALMNHVLKGNFLFAVLDDVLMSVDAGHRRAVCSLLKTRFRDTQFILTTHDPVWLNHMRTERLITARSLARFHSWDVNVGPAFWDDTEIWDEIETELKRDRVSVAAELLRNYLEYIAGELCDRLRARVEFRLDGRMELGDLLPPAYERLVRLYAKGKESANSWGRADVCGKLADRHKQIADAFAATQVDQWQMNAAIHYNSWASLQKQDLAPLVVSFRKFVESFSCPKCQSFLKILRDGPKDKAVTCDCGESDFNLLVKASE